MISVAKAIEIVINNSSSMVDSKTVQLTDSLGYTLSENILSPIHMPPFRQSAMDGYALNIANSNSYRLIGEIKAGDNNNPKLNAGEAVRIFTGAAVPDTANAVVMQEKASKQNNTLILKSPIKLNENIRPLGEQVHQGQIALNKGTKITAAGIAYLASLGITEVKVSTKPTIAIMVTGNELAEPGCNLKYGQIYESNAIMLKVALKKHGYDDVSIHKVDDDYQKTENLLNETISKHDVVLVSGGISVGDYDFVGKALNELDVEQLFYKVKQKPGKPLFFGRNKDTYVFALPGNPASETRLVGQG